MSSVGGVCILNGIPHCASTTSLCTIVQLLFLRAVTLLVIGLDDSGKSTLLANLNGESSEGITPTVGFSSTTMDIGRCTVTFYDLGGGVKIRDIWKNYYAKVRGEGRGRE